MMFREAEKVQKAKTGGKITSKFLHQLTIASQILIMYARADVIL